MKDEEFKQKLSEVAEWRLQDLADLDETGRRIGRGKKNEALDLEAQNPPVELVKIKCQSCTCEDCGKFCEGGRQKEIKRHLSNKKWHWRERCLTCNLYYNPFTEQYDLKQNQVSMTWVNWLRDGRRLKDPKTYAFLKEDGK